MENLHFIVVRPAETSRKRSVVIRIEIRGVDARLERCSVCFEWIELECNPDALSAGDSLRTGGASLQHGLTHRIHGKHVPTSRSQLDDATKQLLAAPVEGSIHVFARNQVVAASAGSCRPKDSEL